jgi:hypothetical protein
MAVIGARRLLAIRNQCHRGGRKRQDLLQRHRRFPQELL